METIKAFIRSHPVLSFFALVFAIAWGGILILAGGPGGIPTNEDRFEMLMPWVLLAWLAGPSVAGIVLTELVYGREGFRDLLARMTRWRVGVRWYALDLPKVRETLTARKIARYVSMVDHPLLAHR